MEEALRALLAGILPAGRINWGVHPQGEPLPGLVLNVIGDADAATLAGRDGLYRGRVQIDCYGVDYGTAKQLARAVRAVLNGTRGGGFAGIFLSAARDHHETGEADHLFRVSLDFTTCWRD